MSERIYTCDICGYSSADRAEVISHLADAHNITDAGEVGRIEQAAGVIRFGHAGEELTEVDLTEWLKQNLCTHPPDMLYAWWAYNYETGKDDILCIGCRACGTILQGAEDDESLPT